MARRPHAQRHVRTAFDMDRLVARLERLGPVGRQILRGIGGIDGLDEQILRVGVGAGDAPGDRCVLTQQHDRRAGHGGALDGALRRHDAREIPEDRGGEFEMRIVGEDGLARRRARSRDHPFVRSAVTKRKQLAQPGVRLVRGGVVRMQRRQRRDRRIRRRRRKDPARLLGRELPSELGPHDLEPVVVAELPSHQLAPDQRIRRLPGLRLVAQDHEFRRQGVGVRIEKRVDAVDIGRAGAPARTAKAPRSWIRRADRARACG